MIKSILARDTWPRNSHSLCVDVIVIYCVWRGVQKKMYRRRGVKYVRDSE